MEKKLKKIIPVVLVAMLLIKGLNAFDIVEQQKLDLIEYTVRENQELPCKNIQHQKYELSESEKIELWENWCFHIS